MDKLFGDDDKLEQVLLSSCKVGDIADILCLTESSVSPLALLSSCGILLKLTSLRQVDFSGFALRLHQNHEHIDQLLGNLGLLPSLRILRLSRCSLSTAKFLAKLPQLHIADLSRNTIFDLGDLSNALSGSQGLALQSLDVSYNSLPTMESLHLQDLSGALSELTNLNCRGCPLMLSSGGGALAAAASFLPSLEMFSGVEIDRTQVDDSPLSESSTYFSFAPLVTHKQDIGYRFRQVESKTAVEQTNADSPRLEVAESWAPEAGTIALLQGSEESQSIGARAPNFGSPLETDFSQRVSSAQLAVEPPSPLSESAPASDVSAPLLDTKRSEASPGMTQRTISPRRAADDGSSMQPTVSSTNQKQSLERWRELAREEGQSILNHQPHSSSILRSESIRSVKRDLFTPPVREQSQGSSSLSRIRLPRDTQLADLRSLETPVTPNLVNVGNKPPSRITSSDAMTRSTTVHHPPSEVKDRPSWRKGRRPQYMEDLQELDRNHNALQKMGARTWEASPKSCSTRESETSMYKAETRGPGTLKNISLPEDDGTKVRPRMRTLRDQPEISVPLSGKPNAPVTLIGVKVSPESQKKAETILDDDPSVRWFRKSGDSSSSSQLPLLSHSDLDTYWRSLSNVLSWALANRHDLEPELASLEESTRGQRDQLVDLMLKFRKMSAAYKACLRRLGALTTVMDGSVFSQLAASLVERSDVHLTLLCNKGMLPTADLSAVTNMSSVIDTFLHKSAADFTLLISSLLYAEFSEMETNSTALVSNIEAEAIHYFTHSQRLEEMQRIQTLGALEGEALSILTSEVSLSNSAPSEKSGRLTTSVSQGMPNPSASELRDLAIRLQTSHSVALKRLLKVYGQWREGQSALGNTSELLRCIEDRIVETSNKLTAILTEYPDFMPPSSPFVV